MKKNMGKIDRWTRAVVAIVAVYLGYMYNAWWYLLAAVAAVTAIVGFCPLYAPFKLSTAGKAAAKPAKKKKK